MSMRSNHRYVFAVFLYSFLTCHSFLLSKYISTHTIATKKMWMSLPSTDSIPNSEPSNFLNKNHLRTLMSTIIFSTAIINRNNRANAVGDLFELKEQSLVFQDISFNVINTYDEEIMLKACFDNTFDVIASSQSKNGNAFVNMTTLSFGPTSYKSNNAFIPGVSSFSKYGGHASLTLYSQQLDEDTILGFEKGNAINFIKIGTDTLRLSKAIAAGAIVKYAYGYIDLDTPAGIPLEIVIGDRRDPMMTVSLKVTDLKESTSFFQDTLGMKPLPFQLARPAGSQFEATQPPNSIYLGYSPDTMGVLLVQQPKDAPPIVIGSQLRYFTVVYDDSKDKKSQLPPALSDSSSTSSDDGQTIIIKSPDGYPFQFLPYSKFIKSAL